MKFIFCLIVGGLCFWSAETRADDNAAEVDQKVDLTQFQIEQQAQTKAMQQIEEKQAKEKLVKEIKKVL